MRPVNLIPAEQCQGSAPALRAGPTAYLLVAVLVVGVIAVTASVLTSNSIAEKEAEVASLEQREADAAARAAALAPYAEFAALAHAREQTVRSLAQSRFDWERVLNELALVIPADVWLTSMVGTASPEVQVEGSSTVATRSQVPGPALELTGCATSQDAVAGFLASLRDIDGVTRVGLDSSTRGEPEDSSAGGSAGGSGGDASCRTRDFIVEFQIIAAFDEVAVPASDATEPPVPPADSTEPVPSTDDLAATPERQQAADSVAEQTQNAEQAANVIGAVR
jgi:Tfp pilus assembly protein PilN